MSNRLRKTIAVTAVFFSLPYGSVLSADEEGGGEWKCPATKGAYAGQICQCLEARQPGGPGPKSVTAFLCPE